MRARLRRTARFEYSYALQPPAPAARIGPMIDVPDWYLRAGRHPHLLYQPPYQQLHAQQYAGRPR